MGLGPVRRFCGPKVMTSGYETWRRILDRWIILIYCMNCCWKGRKRGQEGPLKRFWNVNNDCTTARFDVKVDTQNAIPNDNKRFTGFAPSKLVEKAKLPEVSNSRSRFGEVLQKWRNY